MAKVLKLWLISKKLCMRSWTINRILRNTSFIEKEEAFNMLIRDRKIFPPSFICMEYCTWSWLLTQNMLRGRNLIVRQTKKLYSSPLYGVPLCQLELMPRKGKIHFFGKGTDMAVQELQLRTTRRDTTRENYDAWHIQATQKNDNVCKILFLCFETTYVILAQLKRNKSNYACWN